MLPRRNLSPPQVLTLLGCALGYLLSGILIDAGLLRGTAADVFTSMIPPAAGLVVGLAAHRLYKP